MPTAGDLITLALKDAGVVGVGQTPLAEDANDALVRLNSMIAQWQRKRWLVYHLIDVSIPATGAETYTIGTGGDFNTPRPDRLEKGCFARQPVQGGGGPIDYPLALIESREDYNRIALKRLDSFPQVVFYDAAFPLGTIRVWPVPNNQYEIHLNLKAALQNFATLATTFQMPPEYEEALRFNLITRLRIGHQLPPDPDNDKLAAAALNTIKNANAAIPTLEVPAELARPRLYNIFSDQSY